MRRSELLEDPQNMIDDFKAGVSFENLQYKYRASYYTIKKILVAEGLYKSKSTLRVLEHDRIEEQWSNTIVLRYQNGQTMMSLAKEFNIPYSRVRRILIRHM